MACSTSSLERSDRELIALSGSEAMRGNMNYDHFSGWSPWLKSESSTVILHTAECWVRIPQGGRRSAMARWRPSWAPLCTLTATSIRSDAWLKYICWNCLNASVVCGLVDLSWIHGGENGENCGCCAMGVWADCQFKSSEAACYV